MGERFTRREGTYYEGAMCRLQELENKLENGALIELPNDIVLDEYDKEKIAKIKYEKIKFTKGQKVYKIYDAAFHHCKKPKRPQYKLVEGVVREICHKYSGPYSNYFVVSVAVNIDDKGTHQFFSQQDMFADKSEAEARLEELQEGKQ